MFQGYHFREYLLGMLEFVVGYVFPAAGVVLFFFMRHKGKEKMYQNAPLLGAILAMLLYVTEYFWL